MDDSESLAHTVWECKYHVVWIPKYRRKALYGELRKYLGPVFRDLAQQRESKVEEGHLQVDHVHMLISIPPKYAVAQVVGFIKGKSAIHIARTYWAAGRTSRARAFGPEDTTSPQLAGMRKRSGSTSRSKKRKTSASTNSISSRGSATFRWRQICQPL